MLKITDDLMVATHEGATIATATRTGKLWTVTTWPHPLTRNQAITALTLAEHLASGNDENDPLSLMWREELTHG